MSHGHLIVKTLKGISEKEKALIQVIGVCEDEEVACLIVHWKGYTHNPQGVYLHITTKANIAPYYSGVRATKYGYISYEKPYYLLGTWKYGH